MNERYEAMLEHSRAIVHECIKRQLPPETAAAIVRQRMAEIADGITRDDSTDFDASTYVDHFLTGCN